MEGLGGGMQDIPLARPVLDASGQVMGGRVDLVDQAKLKDGTQPGRPAAAPAPIAPSGGRWIIGAAPNPASAPGEAKP
jgi:hypothetical protein